MTKEEAIEYLEDMKDGLYPYNIRPLADFCIEAIKNKKEVSDEEVEEYCKSRNLILITKEMYEDLKIRYEKGYQDGKKNLANAIFKELTSMED